MSSASGSLGQLLFVGFEGLDLTPDLAAFLGGIRPGGIILFKRNIAGPQQTLKLIADLRSLCDPPPVIAVDEEGGQVSRLRPLAPTLPPAAQLVAGGAPRLRELTASLGRILAAAGFDLDFTPVVDLCRPDSPNGIGDRSFGLDPEQACLMAEASLAGLADAGVAGCLKHFPGLGPTLFDSHHHLPTVQKDEEAFRREDLLPYRRLHPRAPVVMIGHGHYPFLAGADPIAATLTSAICTGLLRREIGYEGLALADDLEMKAVAARIPAAELAPRVVAAGCDMALVCRRRDAIEAAHSALEQWARTGRLSQQRLDEALARVAAFRRAVHAITRRAGGSASLSAFQTACADLTSRLPSTPASSHS